MSSSFMIKIQKECQGRIILHMQLDGNHDKENQNACSLDH